MTSRTPLLQDLRRAFQRARLANAAEAPAPTPPLSRRGLMRAAGAALVSYAAAQIPAAAASGGPRVAVVGAGIAGLNTTRLLRRAGLDVTLYEASDHIGGRIQTAYNRVAPGVYTELGGEFIDSVHADMLGLARLLGLSLIDTQAPSEAGLQVAYYADGRLRTEAEVIAAFQPLAAIVDADVAQLSSTITYRSHSAFDAALDRTPLSEYLSRSVTTDWLFKVLEAAYVNEYGLNLADQSSLNFVETIGTDTSAGFQVYGQSDQRYKTQGGNHQIVAGLAGLVADRIVLGHRLEALAPAGGGYGLTFATDGGARDVRADFVVLCLPFTILRGVDVRVPLPPVKRAAIQTLGYGANAKLVLGFQGRPWRAQGFDGNSYADQPYQSGWDSSREQPTPYGGYTIFPGGTKALDLGGGTADDQARRLLPGLGRVFPDVRDAWLGTALRVFWPADPFVRASYAAYTPGQWTGLRGAERETVGGLYFAGEHTSLDWQGYMNGGAESGRRAAQSLIHRLK